MFVSAAWRRFAVTRLTLLQRAALCHELELRGISATAVIVGDDRNLETADELGFETVVAPNDHLGRKFNDGIEVAVRELDADFIVHIGSDDWVHPSVFDRLPRAHVDIALPTPEEPFVIGRPGPEIQICRRIAFVDLLTGRMRLCKSDRKAGVIPWIIPRVALEPSGFRPIPEDQGKGIDGALLRGLGRPRVVVHDPNPLSCVDWKTPENLNGFDEITGALGEFIEYEEPWSVLAAEFGAELAGEALATSFEMAAA